MHPSGASLYWAVHVLMALVASWHILLNKRQPRSAMVWLLWAWMVPVGGVLLYVALGQDRVGLPPRAGRAQLTGAHGRAQRRRQRAALAPRQPPAPAP